MQYLGYADKKKSTMIHLICKFIVRHARTIVLLALGLVLPVILVGDAPKLTLGTSYEHKAGTWPQDSDKENIRKIGVLPVAPFVDRFGVAYVESFAVSPDGKKIAIEFQVPEGNGVLSQWITLWDTEKLTLETSRRLEEARPAGEWSVQFGHDVRYLTDGTALIVLTGPRVLLLSADNLTVLHDFPPSIPIDKDSGEVFVYKLSLCDSLARVALLRIPHRVFGETFSVMIYSAKDGEVIDQWNGEGQATDIAFSSDCKLVAVSTTGRLARSSENSVHVYQTDTSQPGGTFSTEHAVGDMHFVRSTNTLATIARHHMAPDFYKSDVVRFWQVLKGELVREYEYPKYGLRGNLDFSGDGRLMAVVTEWDKPSDVKRDWGNVRGFARFLTWDLVRNRIIYISEDLKGGIAWHYGEGKYLVRFSGDGKTLAVGGQVITLFRVNILD